MVIDADSFAKFQYSEFTHNGHDAQYVVRTNDKTEFEMLVTYIQQKVSPQATTTPTPPPTSVASSFDQSAPTVPDVTPVSLGVCKKCGAPNITYRTGTIGCSKYCWRKQ